MSEMPTAVCIDEAVIDHSKLPPLAGWLFVVIKRHLDHPVDGELLTVERLAELATMSRASVIRYTKVLEREHLLKVERSAESANSYQLADGDLVADSNEANIPEIPDPVSHSNQPSITQQPVTPSEGETSSIPERPLAGASQALNTKTKDKSKNKAKDKNQDQKILTRKERALPSERSQLIGLCMELWKCPGGEAAMRADLLLGKARSGRWKDANLSTAVTVREFKGWQHWLGRSHRELPLAAWQMQKSVLEFRTAVAYEDAIRDANDPLPAEPIAEPLPPPEVVEARRREYREQVARLANLKTLTPERTTADALRTA